MSTEGLTGAEYAASVAGPISTLGGDFMGSPQAEEYARTIGLGMLPGYLIGRFGVLGDVHPDVIAAAAVFWRSDVIATGYAEALPVTTPANASVAYLQACQAWGRVNYGSLAGADRLAELAWRVVDSSDVTAAPLFAGWRAVPRNTQDSVADAQHALFVLRELRGARHIVAVLTAGLSPLEAVLTGPDGATFAGYYGWAAPYDPVEHLAATRGQAEAMTNALMAPSYDVLSSAERAEFAALLAEAVALASPAA